MEQFELWKNKDFSALCKDIYNNQRATQSQISILIDTLKPLVKTAGDAAVIVPLLRDYLDVSTKNDAHLVRLAAVLQKWFAAEKTVSGGGDGNGNELSEQEKRDLLGEVANEMKGIEDDGKKLTKGLKNAKNEVKQLAENIKVDEDDDEESESEVG